jgi:hypothetical protein
MLINKINKFFKWLYPLILVFTGITIFAMGITSIVVLTKFATFNPHWLYHLCVVPISITMFWWFWYFFYAGIKLLHQSTKEGHPMAAFTKAMVESTSPKEGGD